MFPLHPLRRSLLIGINGRAHDPVHGPSEFLGEPRPVAGRNASKAGPFTEGVGRDLAALRYSLGAACLGDEVIDHASEHMEVISRLQDAIFQIAQMHAVRAFEMSWSTRAKDILRQRGWKIAELARRADIDLEALYKQLRGVEQPRGETLKKIATALGVSPIWLRDGQGAPLTEIPVVGFVSAGEAYTPYDDHAMGASLDTVPLDFGAYPVAIEVRGISMLPVYRAGDRLMCDKLEGDAISRSIGRDCIVMTAAGEGYLKRVLKGSRRGLYTLRSYNPDYADIADQMLAWAAPVVWVRRGQ